MQNREAVIDKSIETIKKIRDQFNIWLGQEQSYYSTEEKAYIYESDRESIFARLQNIVGIYLQKDRESKLSLYDLIFDEAEDYLTSKNVQSVIDEFQILLEDNKKVQLLHEGYIKIIEKTIAQLIHIKKSLSLLEKEIDQEQISSSFPYFDLRAALQYLISGLYDYAWNSLYYNNPYFIFGNNNNNNNNNNLIEDEKINSMRKKV